MAALIILGVFLLIDLYFFQAVKQLTVGLPGHWPRTVRGLFWMPTVLTAMALIWWAFDNPYRYDAQFRNWVITGLFATFFAKFSGVLVLLIGDLYRGGRYIVDAVQDRSIAGPAMSRSEFVSKMALVGAGIPLGGFAFGILSGAHDYRLRRVRVPVRNLPSAWHGLTIGQVSDIHSGSFWNKTAVSGGVELLMSAKPDLICFTGDLVNNQTDEVRDYIPVFSRMRAPLGVYAVTGNHDYGDYRSWPTKESKDRNFRDLLTAHRELGFRLLMNEQEQVRIGQDRLSIVGVENWGAGRFAKYGQLDRAMSGVPEGAVPILLSHDPSHWDAQVRPGFPHIPLVLSGHTHGFQFGVEIGGLRWSPSQYIYKQWAGLYTEGDQHLYVNRGFGYLGYPGRVGMPPEITVLELVKS